ncbi:MAG: outer membrane protein assembly factor BamA, partial [Deltaproteobacteria bacterium]
GTIGQTGHRAAIGFTEPRFAGTRILADIGVHTERIEAFNQTFGTTLHGANLKLSTHPRAPLSLGWGVRYEYRHQFRRSPCATSPCDEDPDLFRPRSLLVTSPSMLYDTRDSFIYPHRGIFSALTVDISRGLQNSLDNFIKYRFDLRAFYTPVKRLTVALRGQVGYIDTYGSTGQIPDDQLFFLGGIGNIRGFAENRLRFDENGDPVGGRQAVSASLETRFHMGLNFELALFFDTGQISETFGEKGRASFRSSIGGGLRYLTPIGPIGLVYGYKLDPLDGESRGRFHLSIGYAF